MLQVQTELFLFPSASLPPQSSLLRKTHVSLLASRTWNPRVIFKASPLFIPHIHSITNPPNSLSSKDIQSLGTPHHLYCASPVQATSFFTWIKKELPQLWSLLLPLPILTWCSALYSKTLLSICLPISHERKQKSLRWPARFYTTSPLSLLCCFLLPTSFQPHLHPSGSAVYQSHPCLGLWTRSSVCSDLCVDPSVSPSGLYSSGIFSNRLSLTAPFTTAAPSSSKSSPRFIFLLSAYHYLICSMLKLIVLFSVLFATYVSSTGQKYLCALFTSVHALNCA